MKIPIALNDTSYDIIIERGLISRLSEYIDTKRKVLIVTDDGVPETYVKSISDICADGYMLVIPAGEQSKSLEMFSEIQKTLLQNEFTRKDSVIGVGGGVVLDLAGFAAATYLRGIDFYSVPTTLLSQLDSSVGGKTGINFNGVKNMIGSFREPKGVFIDPDTLKTLDSKQICSGLSEGIKIAATSSKELFEFLEKCDPETPEMIFDELIPISIQLKMDIVMQDEHEASKRRMLNFGHTIGHAVESFFQGEMTHGQCVAVGMIPMSAEPAKTRIKNLCHKFGIETEIHPDWKQVLSRVRNDKKKAGDEIFTVRVSEIGKGKIVKEDFETLMKNLERELN